LQIQAAQHTSVGIGEIILHRVLRDAMSSIAVSLVGLHEKSALVAEDLGLDDQDTRELGRDQPHDRTSCSNGCGR